MEFSKISPSIEKNVLLNINKDITMKFLLFKIHFFLFLEIKEEEYTYQVGLMPSPMMLLPLTIGLPTEFVMG